MRYGENHTSLDSYGAHCVTSATKLLSYSKTYVSLRKRVGRNSAMNVSTFGYAEKQFLRKHDPCIPKKWDEFMQSL